MDQETPKDPDKRNWRERLGIGTTLPAGTPAKDLPRIGEDYRKVTPAPIAPRLPVANAPRTPAPVAPRAPAPRVPASKVEVKVAPAVKPAPMAPRPAAKTLPPRSNLPAVSPEKLAERLRAQRDASEKFAEQRIQVAKQRAEQAQQLVVPSAPAVPPKPVSPPKQVAANPRPKFSFAEEDAAPAVTPVVQQRSVVPPPAPPPVQLQPAKVNVQPSVVTPQLAPARPPLGTAPGGFQQPRPQQPYQQPNVQQPYFPQQQPYGNNGNGGFAASNYRPIDPATGYPVQPQQYGQQPYGAPPMQRPYGAPAGNYQQQPAPRLGMPSALPGGMQQRPGINPNYAPPGEPGATPPQQGMNPGFGLEARGSGQLNPPGGPGLSALRANRPPLRTPSNPGPVLYDDEPNDELFEEPASRGARRAATDYQQAYREVEAGYDEEAPRNKGPWILLGLLLLALAAAFAGVWYYTTTIKPLMSQSTTEQQQLPVVEAPDTAAKVAPDRSLTAAETPGAPTKKQIYDRIVGDREVLKGDVVPTEEVPLAPADAAVPLPVPDPVQPAGEAGQTVTPLAPAGDSSDPLPIPAPPGDTSPQGSLEDDPNKQSSEVVSPAAGESQAAVAAPPSLDAPLDAPLDALKPLSPVEPETPANPEDVAATDTITPDAIETPKPAVETEAIADTPETAGLPSPKLRKLDAAPKPKKLAAKKEVEKDLGAKPVVLVPVNKQAKVVPKKLANIDNTDVAATTTGDSLFEVGENANSQVITPPAVEPPTPQAPVKKKKTLLDLLNGTDTAEVQQPAIAETTAPTPVTPPAKIIAPKVAPKPVEELQVASNNGFVAQLASFRSKAEATAEFNRLRSKNGNAFQGVNPIISEAEVGGSTRFRLNVGGMDSKASADAFCSKLFASGERDCLVRKR